MTNKVVEIQGEDFRRMQLLQLELIKELDRVCRLHHIRYTISCGTLLGAVRHKGYIPWDDDADITMLREDYERFKRHIGELNPEICFFQDHTTDPEYLWGYAKLRMTDTEYVRVGQEHIHCKSGVNIDIFPLDDVPKTTAGQMIQDFKCFVLRKILWAQVASVSGRGFTKYIYKLLAHIQPSTVHRIVDGWAGKSRNRSKRRVRILLFNSLGKLYVRNSLQYRYSMPKWWFLDPAEYEFEGCRFYGIRNYDAFLKYMYDDYMTLPPESERVGHAPVSRYKF